MHGLVWQWRRRLFVWEEGQLGGCISLLSNMFLQDNVVDS